MISSVLISERYPELPIKFKEREICVAASREGPQIADKCHDASYLVVKPYEGVLQAKDSLEPYGTAGREIEFIDFYMIDGLGISRYRLVNKGGRVSQRRLVEIDLFQGFVKSGLYGEVERAFENYLRGYSSTCIFGCLASLALAGFSENIYDIVRGMSKRGKIFYSPGVAIYLDVKGKVSAIVEIASPASHVELFRELVMEFFRESRGLHWAYMGRLAVSRPSLFLDIFMPRVVGRPP